MTKKYIFILSDFLLEVVSYKESLLKSLLSSAGAQCRHIDHVATQMPYALTVALCASVGYILSGITGNGYIGLAGAAISLALAMMIIVITAKRGR